MDNRNVISIGLNPVTLKLKELRDDINEVGMVKLKCDKNTKPRCDWLIQFLVAYVSLADATKPKAEGETK